MLETKMGDLSSILHNPPSSDARLRERLHRAFQHPRVMAVNNFSDVTNKTLAVHPFLIAPSSTFRTFNKYETAGADNIGPTCSILPWRLLPVREVVDNILNSLPPACVVDPLLLDELSEPEFYQWLKSRRLNPDRVQRLPSAELLRTLQQYRLHVAGKLRSTSQNVTVPGVRQITNSSKMPAPLAGNPQFRKIHNLDQLREKLRLKLDALQAKRNKQPAGTTKEDSRQVQKEIKKLRREEDKVVNKKRKLEQTMTTGTPLKQQKSAGGKNNQKVKGDTGKPVHGPTYNKIKSANDTEVNGGVQKKRPHLTGKNYKRLLNAVHAREEKIAAVAETNPEQAEQLVQKQAWRDALAKAGGIKVRNDPTTITKAIKKQEKRKRAQGSKWDARLQAVDDRQQKRLSKRERNLDKRQDSRQKKKYTKSVKRGHILPGFSNM